MKRSRPPKLRELASNGDTRSQFNLELFTALAPVYDWQNQLFSFGRERHWKDDLIRLLPDRPSLDAVDLACGTGDLTRRLASRYPNGSIIGVDLCPAMLEQARQRDPENRIRWVCADMTQTGLPDRCADVITGAWALRLSDSIERALQEVVRLLRPGGVAAFLDFAQPDSKPARTLLAVLLRIWCSAVSLLICGHLRAHLWVVETLRHVPPRSSMLYLFEQTGFRDIQRRSAFFGAVDLWTARRCM